MEYHHVEILCIYLILAGFVLPEFHGGEEDYEDFVDCFVAYINLANINDNARIVNISARE